MGVIIFNKTKGSNLKEYYKDLDTLFIKTLDLLNIKTNYDIALILVRSKKIKEINNLYRNINKETDVISFAIQDDNNFQVIEESYDLGDIYINVDRVYSQALDYQHSIQREFCFLFVHGLLHCLGYDHMDKKSEKEMIELQNKILESVAER